jgi:DNA-binding NtrC family response regulator
MRQILVVDDYKPFLEDVRKILCDPDTAVFTAETAREALERIGEIDFDLVITDLFMETQSADDGLQVIRAAKRNELTQVIVVTAHGRPELSVDSMRLGAFDYLEKGSPGVNFRAMLLSKTKLALDFRSAKTTTLTTRETSA